jgi:hypothetical protein
MTGKPILSNKKIDKVKRIGKTGVNSSSKTEGALIRAQKIRV